MTGACLPPPGEVLRAYGLDQARAAPLGSGLINQTWLLERDGRQAVLQAVNPIFPAAVNEDIRVVTTHLRARGWPMPELLATRSGAFWIEAGGRVYRLMSYVRGRSLDQLEDTAQARAAGGLLARFHRALDGLDHTFAGSRLGVHDTPRHLQSLRQALSDHAEHARFREVQPLATDILAMARDLPALPVTRARLVHGDPKINNMLFDPGTGQAVCLIDLDTLGPMALPLELGDAFRSWCNPAGENIGSGAFSLDLFGGAVAGYAADAAGWIEPAELQAIVPATLTICVELAARFCADALNERYFGWDATKFPSRSAHNQVRAESQLALARSLVAQRERAEELVRQAFDGA